MSAVTLKINGESHNVDVPLDMPLLWALRDKLDLVGTKYSCGIGVCGSCTVLVNGLPMLSCTMRILPGRPGADRGRTAGAQSEPDR